MTMDIGRDCEFLVVIGQVFRVIEFDRAGTVIRGDKVKAKSLFKPYGYLKVESPILNVGVTARMPILHRDDFLLAASVYDEPKVLELLKEGELLVTYIPKKIKGKGLNATNRHTLHYVIAPAGTLEKYYEVEDDIHMRKPAPEKLFENITWDGYLRVRVNPEPDI
jgi:hypothetical protein